MSTLCRLCRSLCSSQSSIDRLCSPGGYTHHRSIPWLQESAKRGCPLCIMLCDAKYVGTGDRIMPLVYNDPIPEMRHREIMLRGRQDYDRFKPRESKRVIEIELWVDIASSANDMIVDLVIDAHEDGLLQDSYVLGLNDLKPSWHKVLTLRDAFNAGKKTRMRTNLLPD